MNQLLSMPGMLEWVIILVAIIFILPYILYLITLQNTLLEISNENRKMRPGQVWIILIPLFGLVWQFIMINRIADSLQAEFSSRNIPVSESRPGYTIGITYSILLLCSYLPILGVLALLGGLVCWIVYWVKINDYKTKLQQSRSFI